MKIAVVGSRNCLKNDYLLLEKYIPLNATEIISGGAVGIDLLAKKYAKKHNLKLVEFLPDYNQENVTPKVAPILRNKKIVDYADIVFAFWDGISKGTAFTIDYCIKTIKPVKVFILNSEREKLIITENTNSETLDDNIFIYDNISSIKEIIKKFSDNLKKIE